MLLGGKVSFTLSKNRGFLSFLCLFSFFSLFSFYFLVLFEFLFSSQSSAPPPRVPHQLFHSSFEASLLAFCQLSALPQFYFANLSPSHYYAHICLYLFTSCGGILGLGRSFAFVSSLVAHIFVFFLFKVEAAG